jgi:hypothetical protein
MQSSLQKAFLFLSVACFSAALACAQDAPAPAAQPEAEAAPAQPAAPVRNQRRFMDSVKRLFSFEAVTSTLPAAAIEQVHDWPDEWGRHGSGFGKRVASLYGQFVIGVAIEDSVKALHHEDTHFTRLGQGNFFRRTAHVVTGTVLAHKPDGSRTVAWSLPANAYGSWAIATLWSPREYRTAESIAEWGSAGMGATAGLNFFREFWPDLKSVFRKK